MVDRRSLQKSVANLDDLELARDSIHNIKKISQESVYDFYEVDPDRSYRLSYLRKEFTFKGLDELFNRYMQRIDQAYFSLFLILQTVFSITHFTLVLVLNAKTNTLTTVIPDLTLYSVAGLLSLITLYVNERYLRTKFHIVKYLSFLIFILIYLTDLFIPIYYSTASIYKRLRPAYIVHILIANYCFIGLTKDLFVYILGALVTLTHILTLSFITYDGYEFFWKRLGSDIIFMACLNGIGAYHRWTSELIKRRAFLDHRACVESTLKLKYEKEQEEQLMTSIIPEHTIDKVRKDILDKIGFFVKMGHLPTSDPMEIPYVQEYDNVTILYADIVNYTAMTSQLSVVTLVETLNELFSGFDDASEELNVMRIKFLGDCYYSVAGLPPNPAPNHAEACVDLGLKMISIIRSVRERRNLTIDMRIGIHSGRILSGLIGSTKWQFDIWSKDVHIANKMETAGKPGQIHITKQTYDLLTKTSYNIVPSDRGTTSTHLQGYNVKTYFIVPNQPIAALSTQSENDIACMSGQKRLSMIGEKEQYENGTTSITTNGFISNGNLKSSNSAPNFEETIIQSNNIYESRRDSLRTIKTPVGRRTSGHPALSKSLSGRRVTPADMKRRTAFMDNNINRYKKLLVETQNNIMNAIEEMPLTKYDQWVKVKEINPFFLTFKTWNMEKKYIQLPDKLFKFYLVIYVALLVATILIQNINLSQWEWHLWSYYATIAFLIFVLIPLTWMNSFGNGHFTSYRMENGSKPRYKILRYLNKISTIIIDKSIVRTIIYILISGLFLFCVLEELTLCTTSSTSRNIKSVFWVFFEKALPDEHCIIPWHLSYTLSLTILMSFFFIRVHIWLKFLFGFLITTFYGIALWHMNYTYFEDLETFNYNMSPKISDMVTLVFLTFALHLLDRQSDYLNRLDFQWTEKLEVEQVEVNTMNKITKRLLQNILPTHVARLYLDVSRKKEDNVLYNEDYENVAVIFASVTDTPINDVSEKFFLGIVNCIIKDFDYLLKKDRRNPIEKIKVTNLTYMAACGLDPDKINMLIHEGSGEHVAVTLVKFAVDMIKILKRKNDSQMNCNLRIGISHGKVMGGVVGSKKPLYDIWSDAVNMASRMDSTGIPGKIQVTENTAKVLQENGIKCEFRDYIFVKGKEDNVPTYLVALDDDDELIYKANSTVTYLN